MPRNRYRATVVPPTDRLEKSGELRAFLQRAFFEVSQAVNGNFTLDGLDDVVITAAATNDLLQFDGTNWVDVATIAYGNLPSGSGTWSGTPTISGLLTASAGVTVSGGSLVLNAGVNAALNDGTLAVTSSADSNTVTVLPTHATYTGAALRTAASRASSSAFYHLYASSNSVEMAYIRGDGAARFAGLLTASAGLEATQNANYQATLRTASGGQGMGARLLQAASSGKYNWFAGAQLNTDNGYEITPSTAVDGTTFTTPVLILRQSGVHNIVGTLGVSGLLTASAGIESATTKNVAVNGTGSFGGGEGVVGLLNATTVPSSNPTGGGVVYEEGGALKHRGSSGTITELAPA